jgi:hypothetical protein
VRQGSEWLSIARRGDAATASNCAYGKAGIRGEEGRRRCLSPCKASAAGGGDGAAPERQDGGIPELGGEGGGAG